jgi:hypothetical protein
MIVTDFFVTMYTLQTKTNEHREKLREKIKSLYSHKYDTFESQFKGQIDIRDLLKQCPNCKLIWFRIESCPNTTCGNRPSCFFDFVTKALFKYSFIRDRKTKRIVLSKKEELKNEKKLTLNNNSVIKGKTVEQRKKGKSVGCGANMNFDTLPRLWNIDKLLTDLYDCGSLEEVYVKFNKEKETIKAREMIEEKARRSAMFFKH